MSDRAPFLVLVLLLFNAGIGIALFRHYEFAIPFVPGAETQVWQVEARVEFTGRGVPAQIYLTLPPEQSGVDLLSEYAASSGYGFNARPNRRNARIRPRPG